MVTTSSRRPQRMRLPLSTSAAFADDGELASSRKARSRARVRSRPSPDGGTTKGRGQGSVLMQVWGRRVPSGSSASSRAMPNRWRMRTDPPIRLATRLVHKRLAGHQKSTINQQVKTCRKTGHSLHEFSIKKLKK